MTISIIVATHNRANSLANFFAALDRVVAPGSVEMVFVDNASTDATPDVLARFAESRPGVKIVKEPRKGKSKALNAGIAAATGEILVLTDDDMIPRPGWLDELVRPILEGKQDAMVGRVVLSETLQRPWMKVEHHELLGVFPPKSGHIFLIGGSMAVRREFFAKTKGYDEELGPGGLGGWEDAMMGHHLASAGARLGYAETSVTEHNPPAVRLNRTSILAQARGMGRSHAYVMHHWEHLHVRFPLLRKWKKQRQLRNWLRMHPSNPDPEMFDPMEYRLTWDIALYEHYPIEAKRTRRYGKKTLKVGSSA